MRIVALDTYDNVQEGTTYECSDHQAAKLISKGLAKMAEPLSDRVAPEGPNKGNRSAADGQGQPSSASQVDQASPEQIAHSYPGGGLVTPDSRIAEQERDQFEKEQGLQPTNSDPVTPRNQQAAPAQNSQPQAPASSDPPAPRPRGRPPGSNTRKGRGES